MKFRAWSAEQLRKMGDAEPGGLMACSPELLAELKILAGDDPAIAATLRLAGIEPENVEKIVVTKEQYEAFQDALEKPMEPNAKLRDLLTKPSVFELRDGVPCSHPGCLSHVSHPCECCGRIGGRFVGQGEAL